MVEMLTRVARVCADCGGDLEDRWFTGIGYLELHVENGLETCPPEDRG